MDIEIHKYRGDHAQLAKVVASAWTAKHETHVDYDESLIEYMYKHPCTIPELCMQASIDGQLVSFLYSREKYVHYDGSSFRGVLNTLATTHKDFARHFPYLKLKKQLRRRRLL